MNQFTIGHILTAIAKDHAYSRLSKPLSHSEVNQEILQHHSYSVSPPSNSNATNQTIPPSKHQVKPLTSQLNTFGKQTYATNQTKLQKSPSTNHGTSQSSSKHLQRPQQSGKQIIPPQSISPLKDGTKRLTPKISTGEKHSFITTQTASQNAQGRMHITINCNPKERQPPKQSPTGFIPCQSMTPLKPGTKPPTRKINTGEKHSLITSQPASQNTQGRMHITINCNTKDTQLSKQSPTGLIPCQSMTQLKGRTKPLTPHISTGPKHSFITSQNVAQNTQGKMFVSMKCNPQHRQPPQEGPTRIIPCQSMTPLQPVIIPCQAMTPLKPATKPLTPQINTCGKQTFNTSQTVPQNTQGRMFVLINSNKQYRQPQQQSPKRVIPCQSIIPIKTAIQPLTNQMGTGEKHNFITSRTTPENTEGTMYATINRNPHHRLQPQPSQNQLIPHQSISPSHQQNPQPLSSLVVRTQSVPSREAIETIHKEHSYSLTKKENHTYNLEQLPTFLLDPERQQQTEKIKSKIRTILPSSACCICARILYPANEHWIPNIPQDKQRARLCMPQNSYVQIQQKIKHQGQKQIVMTSACNYCSNHFKKGKIPHLFDDFKPIPDCIATLTSYSEYRKLAIASIYCNTFRPLGYSYLHCKGDITIQPNKDLFKGMVGFVKPDESGELPTTPANIATALSWLKNNNPLYKKYIPQGETIRSHMIPMSSLCAHPGLPAWTPDLEITHGGQLPISEISKMEGLVFPSSAFNQPKVPIPIEEVTIGETIRKEPGHLPKPEPLRYDDDDLEAKVFPHLYPYGTGSWTSSKQNGLTLGAYHKVRLNHADPRWRKDRYIMLIC